MAQIKLKVGDKIEIYRIPKNCYYWFPKWMNYLYKTQHTVISVNNMEEDSVYLSCKFYVPFSCLKRIK